VVDWLGWGSVVHGFGWCVVGWGVHHRGVVDHWGVHNWSVVNSVVGHRSMMNSSMMYWSVVDSSVVNCSMVDRGMMDSRVMNWSRVNCSMVDRGSVNNRCRHVDGCWGVIDRGRGMVGRGGGMIRLGSVIRLRSMVHYRSVIGLGCVRKGGRSVDPNNGLLVASVAVDGLRRSCGLAVDQRVDGAMGFVDRHVHRGRVALFERLVMALICGGNGSPQ